MRQSTTDTKPAENPSWKSALRTGGVVGCCSGLVLASIDSVDGLSRAVAGSQLALVLSVFALVVPCMAAAGAALGLWLHALVVAPWPLASRHRPWFVGGLGALPLAAFVVWVPFSWIEESWQSLSQGYRAVSVVVCAVLAATAVVAGRVVYQVFQRYVSTDAPLPRWHWPLTAFAGAAASVAYWADRTILVGLYEDFHYGLAMLFVLATTAVVVLCRAWWTRQRTGRASSAVWRVSAAGLGLALLVLAWSSPAAIKRTPGPISSRLAATLRGASDFDGDGYSSLLGGTDCAPFNGAVAPGAFDVPGNGVDEDCSGIDTRWPTPHPDPSDEVPDLSGYNVLLVTIDALRADHLGVYGYARKTSPVIDELAKESLVFTRAYSQSPKTFDSMPSLFTGLYPSNVPRHYDHPATKGRKGYLYYVTEEVPLLTELIKDEGYSAAAYSQLSFFRPLGMNRGFKGLKHTRAITKYGRHFIKETKTPFFLWLHYLYPHDPYEKHKKFDFGDGDLDRYDSEIAFTDAELGQVIATLKDRGVYEKTIIVLTADHGETFGEHGLYFHSRYLYEELLRVPLLVRAPGVTPKRVDTLVELVDVVPTLHSLLRLSGSAAQFDGQTLLNAADGTRSALSASSLGEIFLRGKGVQSKAYVNNQWRLMIDQRDDQVRLFDVSKDPASSVDVSSQHPDVVRELTERATSRPLRRHGLLFEEFEKTGDVKKFVRGLHVVRQERLLDEALKRIEPHVSSKIKPSLQRLAKRPGLSDELKQRIEQLVERAD